ncbi:lipopolysaccharide biosynthesis protein, partial [Vibrio sp. 10N.222.49.C9]
DFEKKSARKMASNTAILYVKMIITAIFALLTMKLLIESLGVEEYGIFNLIAGVVAMLGFLNSAMTVATQRYLSFNLGKKNICVQKQIFCNSFY